MTQDTHNVRSVSFHPSGDFLLAGNYLLLTNFNYFLTALISFPPYLLFHLNIMGIIYRLS